MGVFSKIVRNHRYAGSRPVVSDSWRSHLVDDEFVEHVKYVVGGWLLDGNIRAIDYCVNHMPLQGSVVEIGSFLGLSTTIIAYALHRFQRAIPFITCDAFRFAGSENKKADYFSTGTPEYREWVMNSLASTISLLCRGNEPSVIAVSSQQFFEEWEKSNVAVDLLGKEVLLGGGISFAYIDGDHTYDGVRHDFIAVDRYLLPGGYLLFDDSADTSSYEGIKDFMADLVRIDTYELIMKAPNYCFRKRDGHVRHTVHK